MDTLQQDLRYALRGLMRMRGVALVAIATLALGIGATTTMFSVVYATLLRPPPFSDPDRLAILFNTQTTPRDGLVRLRWSWRNILALRAAASSFESVASFTGPLLAISGRGDPEQVNGEIVSSEYFRTLRVTPIAGRTFGPAEDTVAGTQPVTIISARLWKRRFAEDPAAIGETMRVNDVPLTIIGILPDGFAGVSGKAELWISPPMSTRLAYTEYLTTPQNFISVVGRLKDGVSIEQANAELAAIGSRFVPGDNVDSTAGAVWSAAAMSLADARVDPTVRRSALVLLAAAACVLVIACVNVASLLLARARMRRREMAVRLAIGSSRRRLVQQLLTEGLLMAVVAGAFGTVLAWWGVDLFARTAPEVVASGRNNYAAVATFGSPSLDAGVLIFALVLTLGTTIVFALVPALQASRPELTDALKEGDRGSGHQSRGLAMLVVSEVALASLLLTGSGLLLEGFARIQNRRTGFVPDHVLTFWVRPPTSRYQYPADGPAILERLLTRIRAVPGVDSAAVNRCTPFTGCSRTVVFFPDRPVDRANAPGVGRHYTSADYFRTLGIPLISGRTLTDADRAGTRPVALVNETGARRFWPGENPIGQRVWFGGTTGPFADPAHAVEIVGVVGDVKYEGVDQPEMPSRADFYTSYLQFSYPDTMVIVKARGAASVLPALRKAVASVDSALPIYDVMTLDERIAAAIARPRFNTGLLSAFAGAALLLAAIGVYGVLSYSVSSRLREIGVRLALGADARRVVALVLGEGLRLASIGAGIGLVAALAASRFIQGLVVGASGADPRILAAVVLVMTVVAAAAAFLPARRASAVDPIVVLRQE
jgi:putative ABC transport system permease protein